MNRLCSILLAEDNPHDAELTLEALDEYHLANQVMAAEDGAETLDYLFRRGKFQSRPNGNPAVVLLDLKMPKVNGIEVLRTIKGDKSLKTIPVVILTSSREEPDLTACYQLGANAYVVKPVDFQPLLEAIKQVGLFWTLINEPPPKSVRVERH